MSTRKTVVRSGQNLTKSIEVFEVSTSVDITPTGDYEDESQQNWDSLITIIGMRAQPVILSEVEEVSDLSTVGDLTGAGFTFRFTTEHVGVFAKHDKDYNVEDATGVLTDLLEGITLTETELVVGDNVEVSIVNTMK